MPFPFPQILRRLANINATLLIFCAAGLAHAQCDSVLNGCDSGCDSLFGTQEVGCLDGILAASAEKGIVWSGDLVQYYQGVVDGGINRTGRYGGLLTYGALLDFGKLGLTQGTLLQIGGQTSFGESINGDTGAVLLAANANGLLPTSDGQDTSLTDFLLTQFLSENFAVFAGRLNTFGGDMNAFAHGRGKTQFMNAAMVINPTAFRVAPYVTYGAGVSILKELTPIFSLSVIDPQNYATRLDLDELFSNGVTVAAEGRLPFQAFGRPGHVLLSGNWSNRTVLNLNELARLPINVSQPLPVASDSWAIYGNFDHYLVTFDDSQQTGFGIFGRWGVADQDTNPFEWFLSAGIGGNSPVGGRAKDTFGIGWFYGAVTDALPGIVFANDSQGVEAYYGVAVSDRIVLSPDVQWTDSSRRTIGDSWTLGLRLYMTM
ncbi:MAG: carbohydrate porin [Aureliella sp.]